MAIWNYSIFFTGICACLVSMSGCTSKPQPQQSGQAQPVTESGNLPAAPDATAYIGYVNEIEETGELYTEIFFNESFDYDHFDEVTQLADSVVFQNDEIKCSRMKLSVAARYFDLRGLASLDLFDAKGHYVTSATISQVVYVEDMIEGFFVAMLEPADKTDKKIAYCASRGKLPATRAIRWELIDDPENTAILRKQFASRKPNEIIHYRTNDNAVFSVVSSDTTAAVIEQTNGKHTLLYSSPTSEYIHSLLAVGAYNGRPLLLAQCGMPDTDMTWTALFAFDGQAYHYLPRQRVTLTP